MLVIVLMSLQSCLASPDTSDADTNSGSETSGTSDIDMAADNKDPNLHNPISRHGYGGGRGLPGMDPKRQLMRPLMTTLAPKTLGEQTVRAALELGVVVGVCLMMGLGFMAMVGLEIFIDWVVEECRRRLFKKPKPLPDIERLHPAELVGKFSRYK